MISDIFSGLNDSVIDKQKAERSVSEGVQAEKHREKKAFGFLCTSVPNEE